MIEIPLPCGRVALISDIDEPLTKRKWHADENNASGKPYVKATINRTTAYLHRVITNCPPIYKVDHRDRDTLNCQRPNLRIATHDLNNANRGGWGLSKFKGVYPAGGKWRARIMINGDQKSLGHFATVEQAARAYDAASYRQFGEFSFLNFPEDFPLPNYDKPVFEMPFFP